jgi:hypothetical protein
MNFYYLEPSAWIKRYYDEEGTDWMQALFSQRPMLACAATGPIEILGTLARLQAESGLERALLEEICDQVERDWNGFIQIELLLEALNLAKNVAKDSALPGSQAVHLASALLLRRRFIEEDDRIFFVTSSPRLKQSAAAYDLPIIDPRDAVVQNAI